MKWSGTARDGEYKAEFSPGCRIELLEVSSGSSQARRFRGFRIEFHLDGRFVEQHKGVRFGEGPCVAAEAKTRTQRYLDAHAAEILAAARAHARAHGQRMSAGHGENLTREETRLQAELGSIEAAHKALLVDYEAEYERARRGMRDRTVVTGIVHHPGWRRSQASIDRDVARMGAGATHVPPSTSYATRTVRDYPEEPMLPARAHEIRRRLDEIASERKRYGHDDREGADPHDGRTPGMMR